ncbi:MAG TPA: 30S ribosomal protein S27ae, partial [Candidatus Poseidoniales archaeon]
MGEPNPKAKWSKYAISDDGTLERKAEHCPNCGPGVFL